jgi:hypothetical protein
MEYLCRSDNKGRPCSWRFGEGLQKFSRSDKAKAEFLLKSLFAFYDNTIENIRAKNYGYDDAAQKLKEYISMRQKSKKGSKTDEGALENPVILKIDKKKRYTQTMRLLQNKKMERGWAWGQNILQKKVNRNPQKRPT